MPSMPQFETSLDESVAILKQVLPLMSQHRVPTIPQNYAVWFDYVSSHSVNCVGRLKRASSSPNRDILSGTVPAHL